MWYPIQQVVIELIAGAINSLSYDWYWRQLTSCCASSCDCLSVSLLCIGLPLKPDEVGSGPCTTRRSSIDKMVSPETLLCWTLWLDSARKDTEPGDLGELLGRIERVDVFKPVLAGVVSQSFKCVQHYWHELINLHPHVLRFVLCTRTEHVRCFVPTFLVVFLLVLCASKNRCAAAVTRS